AQAASLRSFPSLARLKNVGMSEETLLELARRGINEKEVEPIVAERRRGVSDSEILHQYPSR
ncbi:MAG TPA: hypothetical protein VJK29_11960, partial [Terriglobales bacterium]|nr:hypothetical protein [Terriglobales bacterium]